MESLCKLEKGAPPTRSPCVVSNLQECTVALFLSPTSFLILSRVVFPQLWDVGGPAYLTAWPGLAEELMSGT